MTRIPRLTRCALRLSRQIAELTAQGAGQETETDELRESLRGEVLFLTPDELSAWQAISIEFHRQADNSE